MRFIEYLRWRIRLWLVVEGQRFRDYEIHLAATTLFEDGRFGRFVDRLSPWNSPTGYRRRLLRRALYIARHPIHQLRFVWVGMAQNAIYTFAPRPTLGRYENFWSPAQSLRVEWLDAHSEYAVASTGDTGWGEYLMLFENLDVPWSLEPESWLVRIDSHGFVSGNKDESNEGDARRAFNVVDRQWAEDEGDLGPDDGAWSRLPNQTTVHEDGRPTSEPITSENHDR